jgi:hypothetical protein
MRFGRNHTDPPPFKQGLQPRMLFNVEGRIIKGLSERNHCVVIVIVVVVVGVRYIYGVLERGAKIVGSSFLHTNVGIPEINLKEITLTEGFATPSSKTLNRGKLSDSESKGLAMVL